MNEHHYHAVIWIDHREARVFHFSPSDVERLVLHPDHPTRHIHHKANSIGSGHAAEDQDFLHQVAKSFAASIDWSRPEGVYQPPLTRPIDDPALWRSKVPPKRPPRPPAGRRSARVG